MISNIINSRLLKNDVIIFCENFISQTAAATIPLLCHAMLVLYEIPATIYLIQMSFIL